MDRPNDYSPKWRKRLRLFLWEWSSDSLLHSFPAVRTKSTLEDKVFAMPAWALVMELSFNLTRWLCQNSKRMTILLNLPTHASILLMEAKALVKCLKQMRVFAPLLSPYVRTWPISLSKQMMLKYIALSGFVYWSYINYKNKRCSKMLHSVET